MKKIIIVFLLFSLLACQNRKNPPVLIIDESDSISIFSKKVAKLDYNRDSKLLPDLLLINADGAYFVSKESGKNIAITTETYALYKFDFNTLKSSKIVEEVVTEEIGCSKSIFFVKNYSGYNNGNYIHFFNKNYSLLHYYLTFAIHNGIFMEINFDINNYKSIYYDGDINISDLSNSKIIHTIKSENCQFYTCFKFSNNGKFVVICSCPARKRMPDEDFLYTIAVYDEKGNEMWNVVSLNTASARVSNDGKSILALISANDDRFEIYQFSKSGKKEFIGCGENAFYFE